MAASVIAEASRSSAATGASIRSNEAPEATLKSAALSSRTRLFTMPVTVSAPVIEKVVPATRSTWYDPMLSNRETSIVAPFVVMSRARNPVTSRAECDTPSAGYGTVGMTAEAGRPRSAFVNAGDTGNAKLFGTPFAKGVGPVATRSLPRAKSRLEA